jgi:MHS family shikimate/dehydroshikimate transporter-like MFS transporter
MIKNKNIVRVSLASGFGTLFEWYDFLIYAVATGLVFNKIFFPATDPAVGVLLSMLTFGVGYVVRPLGGIIFGYYGDRVGRKSMLMFTLILMGISTFAIGLLPTYKDIGIWAPVMLVGLRILQGLSFGGEWAGGSIMILEHAPSKHRGLFASLVQMGYPIGFLLASGVFLLTVQLSGDQFLEWAWRMPFLLSAVLIVIGIIIRSRISETPVFQEIQKQKKTLQIPVLHVLKHEKKPLLLGIGIKISEIAWGYLPSVFFPLWAINNLGVTRADVMHYIFVAMFIAIVAIPAAAYLSDRVGRRKIFLFASGVMTLLAVPIWYFMQQGQFGVPVIIGLVAGAIMLAPLAALLPESFSAASRYTGASLANQIAAAIGGGVVPAVASWIAISSGSLIGVGILMAVLSLITFLCTAVSVETQHRSLV